MQLIVVVIALVDDIVVVVAAVTAELTSSLPLFARCTVSCLPCTLSLSLCLCPSLCLALAYAVVFVAVVRLCLASVLACRHFLFIHELVKGVVSAIHLSLLSFSLSLSSWLLLSL